MKRLCCDKCGIGTCDVAVERTNAEESVMLLREVLLELLRFATKPQPRDEEEQEQIVAKIAKCLKLTK